MSERKKSTTTCFFIESKASQLLFFRKAGHNLFLKLQIFNQSKTDQIFSEKSIDFELI